MLKDKTILLGVTGGIAAYKSASLASSNLFTFSTTFNFWFPLPGALLYL